MLSLNPPSNFALLRYDPENDVWTVSRSFQSSCFAEAREKVSVILKGVDKSTLWVIIDTETSTAQKLWSGVEYHVNVEVV